MKEEVKESKTKIAFTFLNCLIENEGGRLFLSLFANEAPVSSEQNCAPLCI